MGKIVKAGALVLVAVMLLGSCVHNSDFNGGVLLDSDKMSEIRAEVFSFSDSESAIVSESYDVITEHPTETSEIHDVTTTEHPTETSEIHDVMTTEQASETMLEQTEESCESTECESEYNTSSEESSTDIEEDGIVYWTKNGGVWHFSRDCRYIINSEVESGAVEDAIEAGKDRACSSCGG